MMFDVGDKETTNNKRDSGTDNIFLKWGEIHHWRMCVLCARECFHFDLLRPKMPFFIFLEANNNNKIVYVAALRLKKKDDRDRQHQHTVPSAPGAFFFRWIFCLHESAVVCNMSDISTD